MFTKELVCFLEEIGTVINIAIKRVSIEKQIIESEKDTKNYIIIYP